MQRESVEPENVAQYTREMVTNISVLPIDHSTHLVAQHGLRQVVENLAGSSEIALARIWLLQPEQSCEICRRNAADSGQECSLHLAASAGRSRVKQGTEVWDRLDGASHRFPLNSQKIGQIGATGEPLIVRHAKCEPSLTNPQWLKREGIQSFVGYPLMKDGQIFGVMAVFCRRELSNSDIWFLGQIAQDGSRLLTDAIRIADQHHQLERLELENRLLRNEVGSNWGSLVARSAGSRKWDGQIRLAAQHRQPVLIRGESGTGKEFTARLIHQRSINSSGAFLKIDAAALTCELLHSLFAAGGTTQQHRPTVFLDAIDRAPVELQARLADIVLAHSMPESLAAMGTAIVSGRLLAATSTDLQEAVASGNFLNELYCALSVTEILVPPLRDRLEDLRDLCAELLVNITRNECRVGLALDTRDIARLERTTWSGNVRELRHILESAAWHSDDGRLVLPENIALAQDGSDGDEASAFVRADVLKRQERANVLACLKQCRWKVYGSGGAAEKLGMKPTSLMYRMKALGIQKPKR